MPFSATDILTEQATSRALDAARDGVLRDAAREARLWDAFRQGRMDDTQARRLISRIIGHAKAELGEVTTALISGRGSLSRWARRMVDTLIPAHLAASLALLGVPEAAPADAIEMRAAVNRQGRLLDRFRAAIGLGAQPLDGTAVSRARLYGAAAWGTAEDVRRARMIRDGYSEDRRILDDARHCRTCPAEARKGWQPIGTLKRIGDSECGANCRCRMIFK